MKKDIKIISLDLDGTLLNSQKKLSERNRKALEAAAAAGIYIVPTTGRLARALSPDVSALPFLQYVIAVNGANVSDIKNDLTLMREELTNADTLEILDVLKNYDGVYDCYIDGKGYMSESMLAKLQHYTFDQNQYELVKGTRVPVADIHAYVREKGCTVQKSQIMFPSTETRDAALPEITKLLPKCLCTCSYPNNIEINSLNAHKGAGLKFLCEYLHIPMKYSMAFGDGSNDISMLQMAGTGVAMGNAKDEIKQYADMIAPDCDDDGVAKIIEEYVL